MSSLLEQFIQEGRDFLQGIGEKLIELEDAPDSTDLMTELFRLVHTLKGNSGLFEFPEMTRVLHAGEDLMDAVRNGRVGYSRELADNLLDAMDFVGMLLDEIEGDGQIDPAHAAPSNELAKKLRALIPAAEQTDDGDAGPAHAAAVADIPLPALATLPEAARLAAWRAAAVAPLFLVAYRPDDDCFFKGEDPLHQSRHAPGLVWGGVAARASWPKLAELDCYRCQLDFHLLVSTARAELDEYFRYTPEQVHIAVIDPLALMIPQGHPNGGPVYGDFVAEALELLAAGNLDGLRDAASTLLELSAPDLWLSSALRWLLALLEIRPEATGAMQRLIESLNTLQAPDFGDLMTAAAEAPAPTMAAAEARPSACVLDEGALRQLRSILDVQLTILTLAAKRAWQPGGVQAVAATLSACLQHIGDSADEVAEAMAACLEVGSPRPLQDWLEAFLPSLEDLAGPVEASAAPEIATPVAPAAPDTQIVQTVGDTAAEVLSGSDKLSVEGSDERRAPPAAAEGDARFGRRAEDAQVGKVLKVEQSKVDRLMNLIGEMVVAKNSLPYLANRAENQFGVRELAREIKAQYGVINRIAEEMQDAIMQVRMMPVSFIFQRFPRLVRDISRKLGKEVQLELQGEETEADKNIVEALADPLIHVVRNSLDHGLEAPDVRVAAGKTPTGRLLIRASQESDRVVIEIVDDGRGIDPNVIKRKAYEKGLIDEAQLERINDQDAVNLVFAAGFSTAESITDLSGRGVGMDVVRNAISKVGGGIELRSEVGKGTTLRLSLPLSMAVTNVMIIESDRQIFGVPMDMVVETVRLPRAAIRTIKRQTTTVLRGRIIPLISLNGLLAVNADPIANADDELAALVVRVGNEQVGLIVDEFREVVDVILKPLPGELAKLSCYAGTALLGDGSVLMVLNPKELF